MPRMRSILTMSAPLFPGLKETAKSSSVRFVGSQLNGVDPSGQEEPAKVSLGLELALGERLAFSCIACIYFNQFASFGVFQNEISQSRQFELIAIRDLYCHHVMPPVCLTQGSRRSLAHRLCQHGDAFRFGAP